jgi:hypothetical protein
MLELDAQPHPELLDVALQRFEVDPEFSRDRERFFARERLLDASRSSSHSYLLQPVLRGYIRQSRTPVPFFED